MRKFAVILITLLGINVVWNIFLNLNVDKETTANYLFNVSYSLIFLFGAVLALIGVKKTGIKTTLGKSLFVYACALISYTLALVTWAFYNLVLQSAVPYPGLPDLFFVLFQPLSALGLILFLIHLGVKFTWSRVIELLMVFGILFIILYSFLNQSSLGEELPLLTRVLNILYPLLDAFNASLAIIAIRTDIGRLHPKILIFAFASLFLTVSDTIFSYRSAHELYWNGDISDTLYMIAASLFAFGIITVLSSEVNRTKQLS